ncbi:MULTISPECIES: phage tail protein [Edwardsiella]|uniref:Gifsy-2 prophage minor tail protein n=2 Tax=Edwardsiella TaxID=635 RepID=A0A0H3DZA9_EDWTF|nr:MULTISPECIES: phage tail protein [Edwardsiella]ADM43327.1 Gifsy-2 prophage minor tail protein [Edwardsiella tarda FL6-60]AKR78399.1 phage tail protein [Edwardsiella sp. LADL05-105]EKS7766613.1 phage tail protein [Edwardsiella piscicida]EKS7794147.1 phage tail protein [Edwardsiella piscicida]ELM3729173.1 phage tail protein [Edwardsiella piscicida]
METFRWQVRPDMVVESEPRVHVVKFGEGYEQRRSSGLNGDLKSYEVTIKVSRDDAHALEAFLSRHGGVSAFLWTPPYVHRQIRVVCRKWASRVEMLNTVFTATFNQVIS